jgi:2-dehydro-3-deoxy-D-arabinonate dehydratase
VRTEPYRLAKTRGGIVAALNGEWRALPEEATFQNLLRSENPGDLAAEWFASATPSVPPTGAELAPIDLQEVWAAGVTYSRSKTARMSETSQAGADRFYDMVYEAPRPELFLKATPGRVVGPGAAVRIRTDSSWNVPEPELTIAITRHGSIAGYTVGNDMSSRSIEGENPLYLPQAKIYSGSAALGPVLAVGGDGPGPDTSIAMEIERDGRAVFAGETTLAEMRREFDELISYLFHDNEFPEGVFLMTGTGVVPDDEFTLYEGDVVRITIGGIGTLENHVRIGI